MEAPKDKDLVNPVPDKLLPKLSSYVVSPYNKRKVNVTNKINEPEKKLFSWIIDPDLDKRYVFHI